MKKQCAINRSIKIQPKYRANKFSTCIVPEIKLCGKWLSENGFEQGLRVQIAVQRYKLVITTLKEA